jgi:alpha-glucosidase
MNRKKLTIFWSILIMAILSSNASAADYQLASPDNRINVKIQVTDKILYSVTLNSVPLISPSPISMTIDGAKVLGRAPSVKSVMRSSENQILKPVVCVKSKTIKDNYNQITITFEKPFSLIFRAYDDAVAYRIATRVEKTLHVIHEEVAFNFPTDFNVYFPAEDSFHSSSERIYQYLSLSSIDRDKFCSIPALVDTGFGPKIVLTEADLLDYPGLYLAGTKSNALKGILPEAAKKEEQENDRKVRVTERHAYLAKTEGIRSFPWRVMVISEKDADLLTNQSVYKLSTPLKLKDTSWIKPGKVAWEWYNASKLSDVDFTPGVNTQTYKYYIDFASKYGIEYVILDEGWYVLGDLMKISEEVDVEEICEYAESKNVGIILWVVWKTLDDQLDEALDKFEKLGVKGIKVDFMDRDDQWIVNYYEKIVREAAKRKLLVDFHGSFKPTGLRRAYPNLITREGVMGNEYNKWSANVTPKLTVTTPFTRMLAGPMDFTPGAMRNAQPDKFKADFNYPMSLGTRCRQLAMYVIYESPLQMLCDSPSLYLKDAHCMDLLGPVPTTWDETVVLDAKVAEFVVIARRKDSDWYLAGMTDDNARSLDVNLSFLGPGTYTMTLFIDSQDADKNANHYEKAAKKVTAKDSFTFKCAPGGAFAAKLKK